MREYPRSMSSRRLRVAYVISMSHGLHSFVSREIRELLRLGTDIDLYVTRFRPGPYMPEADWPIERVALARLPAAHARTLVRHPRIYLSTLWDAIKYGALVDFGIAVPFAERIVARNTDVIHCHFGDHKLFIGYFAGILSSRPTTTTIHAYELYRNPNPRLFRHVLNELSGIVTISDFNRQILASDFGVADDRVHLIRLFVDIPTGERPELSGHKVIVLMVARFVPKKGHHTLLQAIARLPQSFEVWLVGRGPLNIHRMARILGVSDRVRVLTDISHPELEQIFQKAAIYCQPSEVSASGDREGIPVALMEAMAHGLPVVATNHAGIPELVEGVLIDEGDSEALARALTQLGDNPEMATRLGKRNREIVETEYSPKNATLLKALFERIAT